MCSPGWDPVSDLHSRVVDPGGVDPDPTLDKKNESGIFVKKKPDPERNTPYFDLILN